MSSLSRQCSERNAATDKFPVELWIEVFRNISHRPTLAHIMQVNGHFCAIAEEQLYHTVSLIGQDHFSKFRFSLESSPHRAPFVQDIRLLRLEVENSSVPNILPSFLTSLRNLRRLELTQVPDFRFTSDTPYCDALSAVQIPHLRRLRIEAGLHPYRFLTFLEAQADFLEELEMTNTRLFKDPPVVDLLAARRFPLLQVLECDTLFLGGHTRIPVPPNLTHLSRSMIFGWELPVLAQRLGTQLVGLKLDSVWLDDRSLADGPPSWSLLNVKAKFPRLRYLQAEAPYIRNYSAIDWFPDKAVERTDTKFPVHPDGAAPQSHSRLTIAWVFDFVIPDDCDAWEQSGTENAVRILTALGGYVERVLLNRASRWISVRLGAGSEVQGERKVIKEEMGNMDRYWAQV
ncbi:hypothetical protein GSI_00079 [Ganoderma sinense ZZ0214-1]|uniref:F-box domain-containing protein n=1 Tax=Ganoderma sinense ZZ0214-1 TaxID=1077348 RepID=A0A2G8SRI0_9APHY|nr:hypothetical protein GSI_00079 [Ganoderma sinense ZZ0214-1]